MVTRRAVMITGAVGLFLILTSVVAAQGPFVYTNTASDVQAIFGGTTRDSTIQMGKASGGAAVEDVLHLNSGLLLGNAGPALLWTEILGGGPYGLRVNAAGATLMGDLGIIVDATTHAAAPYPGIIPIIAESPLGQTEKTQVWRYGPGVGGDRAWMLLLGTSSTFGLLSANFGNNVPGTVIEVGPNTSAGIAGPAAGAYLLGQASGGARYIWVDAAGCLRFGRNPPTGSTAAATTADASGVVIGTCLP